MKLYKKFLCILILFCIIFTTGCSSFDFYKLDTVKGPLIKENLLTGKWKISKFIFKNESDKFKYKKFIGKDIYFFYDGFIIDDYYTNNIECIFKKINADKYLSKVIKIGKEKFQIDNKNLIVIDFYLKENEKFLFEVFKTHNDTAYIIMNDILIQIVKSSKNLNEKEISNYMSYNNLIYKKFINLKSIFN